jgi:signal transduction histidine kinase
MNSTVTFLLVDDLEENLIALEALLQREGLVLLKARSGSEALELLLVHDVALALIDVQMPEMDGFELAEYMRGTERTRRVPIIFLTAGAPDRQRRFRGYEAGAVDFLTKPIETHVLQSKAGVFFELSRERQEVARQRDELKAATAENVRLLEETQRTAEALREADRRKDEFLATLAHELRNPLAPIANGLQIIKAIPHGDAAQRARDMMERQLQHMVRLVDDLLDISRVTSGKIQLKLKPLDLRSAVEAAIEATRPMIESMNHNLDVRLPKELMSVEGDPTRLAQVIGNLLTNAAKYTTEGGQIEISASSEGKEFVIRVTDSGVGIPSEMLPKVFDMFTQVGKHVDRSQGGLGIGLALVRKLVELHGGSVSAESAGAGEGSTFIVRFPVANRSGIQTDYSEHANKNSMADSGGRRILIVDDNVDGAESLSLLLSISGHKTAVALNGPEGLEKARMIRPEVVFLDIGLPGMDGYDVAKRLRLEDCCSGATLVAMTGWGSEEDRKRSKEAGFDFHMTKPVDLAQLDSLLSKV